MTDSFFLQFFLIPMLICFARICDVTLGTLRIMYVARGMKNLAAILGFFEITIWLFALGQIMQNLDNYANFIAFAMGYALGNYIGVYVEEKLSIGTLMLRIITKRDAEDLVKHLRNARYGLTNVKAQGAYGPVDIIFTVIKRKRLKEIIKIIRAYNPNAFYTIEEVKGVSAPVFPLPYKRKSFFQTPLSFFKKAKI